MADEARSEAARLERLWGGPFGDAYVGRNAHLDERRTAFWRDLFADLAVRSVLEVGCGQGANLKPIAALSTAPDVWGIDINETALAKLRVNVTGVNAVRGVVRELPFRDRWFDLVFTMGVLIHQPDETLPLVMAEIVRCSRRYVLWGEYVASERTEVPYHGEPGALVKREFGRIYGELFPELIVCREGFLGTDEGFDRITWQLLERP